MRLLRMLVFTLVMAFHGLVESAGAPPSAEIVYFRSGQALPTAGHRIEDDHIILELRGGGEVRADRSFVIRIELDESPRPGPAPTPPVETRDEAIGRMLARPYGELIQQASAAYGVSPYLIHALIEVESQYESTAVSPKGAMGLMQLMPALAEDYSVRDPFDPLDNIDTGTRHLRSLIDEFGIVGALAAYNAGKGSVRRFDGVPPYPETRRYVNRVMDLVDANQSD